MKNKMTLTAGEMVVMEILWASGRPMTARDILSNPALAGWSSGYLHNVLRSMLAKDAVKVNGLEQSNTQYARIFEPAVTKPEYGARIVLSLGLTREQMPKLIDAIKKQAGI